MIQNRPPRSNQGGPKFLPPMPSVHLDWLSYTVPWLGNDPLEIAQVAVLQEPEFQLKPDENLPGMLSYTVRREYEYGTCAWHPEHPEFRLLVQFSGTQLAALDRQNISHGRMIDRALACQGKITRLDIAVDLYDWGVDIEAIRKQFEAGEVDTKAGLGGLYKGIAIDRTAQVGQTLYIGSSKSNRQMRIYDKAAEQGVPGDWVRVELVARKELAHNIALDMSREGVPNAGRAAIRAFFRSSGGLVVKSYAWSGGGINTGGAS